MANFNGRDPFGNMDDIFNQLMGNMGDTTLKTVDI